MCKLGGLFPSITTVGRKVSHCSLTTLLATGLEPSTLSGEGADLSTNSKLNLACSPGVPGLLVLDHPPSPLPTLPPRSFLTPLLPTAWDRPHPILKLRRFALSHSTHSPRSQIGSATAVAAPGPSVPSLPSNPQSSPTRAPNPNKGWLRLSPALLGSSLFSFVCNTSGPWRRQPPSHCCAPPRDCSSPWPPRLRAADSAAPLTHRPFPTS